MQTTRRDFLKTMSGASAAVMVAPRLFRKFVGGRPVFFQIPGGSQDPDSIPKWAHELVKPPAMPFDTELTPSRKKKNIQRYVYDIAVRQFDQQILPSPYPKTAVWSYGSVMYPDHEPHATDGGTFFYPAFTIEAVANKETMVTWRNELVDENGDFLPHLLPIDQTLHWANPPGGKHMRDHRGDSAEPYTGPVPIVTHVHGAHVSEESDGYAEAWYLPDAANIPDGYARTGTFFDYYNLRYGLGGIPGAAVFKYPNDQPAATLWYHDHTLGMTRANVYAGPAGFWLIRKGGYDADLGYVAPGVGDDPFGAYTEIPIAIQDRSFNADGSLFYPDNRAFFEGLNPKDLGAPYLDIPFRPEYFDDGGMCVPSDVSPIWNPEFFGNVMVVNGRAWPYLEVEQRRYRLRLLNGCNSRFLILDFSQIPGVQVWQIGAEQGFLPAPHDVTTDGANRLLMAPAERADLIVDFTHVDPSEPESGYTLLNVGPDEPFGGGEPDLDFDVSDPATTGQVMQFRVVPATGPDLGFDPGTWDSAAPMWIAAPALGPAIRTRTLSLNELESESVKFSEELGNVIQDQASGEPFGPTEARLGTYDLTSGVSSKLKWSDVITEVVENVGDTEIWEIYNFTADAHPMHLHLVKFEVLDRQAIVQDSNDIWQPTGPVRDPELWETGFKDTVIAYPGEVTRIKATFDLPGFYVWHCHIVEHEDNEMMRPFHVGPVPLDAPAL